MTKWILAAGAATLAITSPALAERGGHGGGKGGEHAAKAQKGGGGNAGAANADRGGGNARAAKMDGGGGKSHVAKADRGGGHEARSIQGFAERGGDKKQSHAVRLSGSDNKGKNRVHADRGVVKVRDENRVVLKSRDWDDRRVGSVRIVDNDRRFAGVGRGLIDGCPPGLAKKLNGCLPPGQAKKIGLTRGVYGLGAIVPTTFYGTRVVPSYYRNYDRSLLGNLLLDNDDYYYRYGDGYMYRVDRNYNMIAGLIPLLGGGYSVGQPYPLGFGVYNVPNQYRTYYADNDDYYYRYGDGGIYQVDRSTGLIAAIVSLLAGGLTVGQPLPLGYDAYNMPLAYRTTYYDTPDAWYRYNDGYVYQVEPRTRLVQRVIVV